MAGTRQVDAAVAVRGLASQALVFPLRDSSIQALELVGGALDATRDDWTTRDVLHGLERLSLGLHAAPHVLEAAEPMAERGVEYTAKHAEEWSRLVQDFLRRQGTVAPETAQTLAEALRSMNLDPERIGSRLVAGGTRATEAAGGAVRLAPKIAGWALHGARVAGVVAEIAAAPLEITVFLADLGNITLEGKAQQKLRTIIAVYGNAYASELARVATAVAGQGHQSPAAWQGESQLPVELRPFERLGWYDAQRALLSLGDQAPAVLTALVDQYGSEDGIELALRGAVFNTCLSTAQPELRQGIQGLAHGDVPGGPYPTADDFTALTEALNEVRLEPVEPAPWEPAGQSVTRPAAVPVWDDGLTADLTADLATDLTADRTPPWQPLPRSAAEPGTWAQPPTDGLTDVPGPDDSRAPDLATPSPGPAPEDGLPGDGLLDDGLEDAPDAIDMVPGLEPNRPGSWEPPSQPSYETPPWEPLPQSVAPELGAPSVPTWEPPAPEPPQVTPPWQRLPQSVAPEPVEPAPPAREPAPAYEPPTPSPSDFSETTRPTYPQSTFEPPTFEPPAFDSVGFDEVAAAQEGNRDPDEWEPPPPPPPPPPG